jgi:mono/diheme cytochrome c family protein
MIATKKGSYDSATPSTLAHVGARHRRAGLQFSALLTAVCAVFLCIAAADGAWLKDVPDADRQRVNPYAGQKDAIAAGNRVFLDKCAKCHGDDGTGRKKKPSLRTDRVQRATDGEIFWLLKNGSLKHGMPSWSAMPEPMRWQVVTFVKSLGTNWFSQSKFSGGSEGSGR